jgi:hypothetical protein
VSGPAFDARMIVEILERYRVEYVLVGGFAAVLYGARRPTEDIDIAPAGTPDNLQRLSAALGELQARIRVDGVPEGLAFDTSGEALRGMTMLNLRTAYGDCDLTFAPAGFPGGYADLIAGAHEHRIGDVIVKVAALGDIIRSKASANRPKDHEALPELEELARRLRRGERRHPPERHPPGIDI